METSTERILTTHVGSLPRPRALFEMLGAREAGEAVDETVMTAAIDDAVTAVVARQVATGLDIVSDGEMSKTSYATYLKDRLNGFGGKAKSGPEAQDLLDYRDFARRLVAAGGTEKSLAGAACDGPLSVRDNAPLERDIATFAAARAASAACDGFLTSCSPGVVTIFLQNQYYPSHDAYLEALAAILKPEYEAIVASGALLQIDCPDLAMGRHLVHASKSTAAFREVLAQHVAVLNAATADIPPDRMRMHLCWGNYAGPHHHDVALEDIIDEIYRARPQAISIEAANPRHAHEWEVFVNKALPDDRILIPGVIDSTTNIIEHPRLVAERLCRFAAVVGRERVIAGTDCGFATFAVRPLLDPEIAWAKLGSLVEGARIASERLWG